MPAYFHRRDEMELGLARAALEEGKLWTSVLCILRGWDCWPAYSNPTSPATSLYIVTRLQRASNRLVGTSGRHNSRTNSASSLLPRYLLLCLEIEFGLGPVFLVGPCVGSLFHAVAAYLRSAIDMLNTTSSM